jgi:Protein of unknown function (DUF2796)
VTRQFRIAATTLLAAFAISAYAADSPVPTVMHIDVGTGITVTFELSGKDAVGFTHRQRTAKEDDAVGQAMTTLLAAHDWMHFNDESQCTLTSTSIGANLYREKHADAPKLNPPLTKPAFDVGYTFTCNALPALQSLQLQFIAQFPRVREVIVDVRTPTTHHAEIVTTSSATVSVTPK